MISVNADFRRRLGEAFVAPIRAVTRTTTAVTSTARVTKVGVVITVVTDAVVATIYMLLQLFPGV